MSVKFPFLGGGGFGGGGGSADFIFMGARIFLNFRSCTCVRGPPVALHVSRYTCRSRFPQNLGVFQV